MVEFKPCPDFELAPLKKLPPDILESTNPEDRKLNGFMLSLSLIFNDLKGLLWVVDQLVKGQPQGNELTTYRGQWGGMNCQFKRMIISTLWELLVTIDKNKDVLDQKAFKSLVKKLKPNFKKSWDAIVGHTAQTKDKKSPIRVFMASVRNNVGYHYWDVENLLKGYESWRKLKSPASSFAGFSLGQTMEQTRFYFADAAGDVFLEDIFSKHQLNLDDLKKVINQVNEALRFLIDEFLKTKIRK